MGRYALILIAEAVNCEAVLRQYSISVENS